MEGIRDRITKLKEKEKKSKTGIRVWVRVLFKLKGRILMEIIVNLIGKYTCNNIVLVHNVVYCVFI